MTTHPPADWYQDPADPSARRFWDGEEWTTLVAGGRRRPELESAAVPSGGSAGRPSSELEPVSAGSRHREAEPARVPEVAPTATGRGQAPTDDTQHRSGGGTARVDGILARTALATPRPESNQTSTSRETPMARLAKVAPATEPSTTVTAIAELMATVDAKVDQDEVEDGRTPRIVLLLVALLIALAATVGVTLTCGHAPAEPTAPPPPPAPQVSEVAEVPASEHTAGSPVEVDPTPEAVDLEVLYGSCQAEVEASPLSTDVRLVFQPDDEIVVEHHEARTLLEFWVRKQGDRAEENRVAFVCLVPDGVTDGPLLFAEL